MRSLHSLIDKYSDRNWLHTLIIVLFCYLSFALPLQILGLPSGFDMLTNIQFAMAYQDAFAAGQLFPSWANDNYGYGSVGIRFYPPLSTLLLAVTHLITNDWFSAFLANFYFWLVLGCMGMYQFVKEWGNPLHGLLAGMLYAVAPQHLAEVFQFFMFAESAAWGVIPFCFLFVTRICRYGRWGDTFLFACAYSVLILTHLPTTIIVSICLPIYVLLVMDFQKYKLVFVRLISAIAITLLATSFRWVILVSELTWLAHNGPEHYASGYYDFRLWLFPNFWQPRALFLYVLTSWLFDIAIMLTMALIIPAVVFLVTRPAADRSFRRVLIASLLTTLFAFFMLSKLSFSVWDNITLLQKLQFPFRWMSVLSMFSVLVFSLSLPYLLGKFSNHKRLVAYPALALVVAIMLFDVTQIIVPSAPVPTAKMALLEERAITEPIWKGWWPTWATEKAFEKRERVVASERKVEISNWGRELKEFVVDEGTATSVAVQNFYYPNWKATVNDLETEIVKDTNGAMMIPISGDRSRILLRFEEPTNVTAAGFISIFTWLSGFLLILVLAIRRWFRLTLIGNLKGNDCEFPERSGAVVRA
jgi:hypothetical protein